ncbi:MAG: threonine synthase [Chitinophagaceae bacterium]|uniref:threonine synthase n=1 Tax=unclassified Paraflavitalea TaxID=2798305 RepID=UPI003D328DC2|nr:threonine synthase [Chitinophagaceae bacterium]
MQYYSLAKQSPVVDFKEATIAGQAPDKSLYFPSEVPKLCAAFFDTLESKSEADIAFEVLRPYVGATIAEDALYNIVSETVNFPIPLVPITNTISSLELFHGPTLAFKDIGARFMSRCLGAFVQNSDRKVTVLVATSGDTGGAVADGFYKVPGVEVVILYPSGKVSPVQEKQLTALGHNIHALEVKGSFDDCQRMVKQAFTDEQVKAKKFLTSANSINVARWLPQQVYYFFAYKQWKQQGQPPVITVPSGNFGNICAGVLAYQSGLPVKQFIAACNANDTIPRFLESGKLEPRDPIPTLSNAMDVAVPSNFVRILEFFHQELPELREMFKSVRVDDATTLATIERVYKESNYLLDPHGAVGYYALEEYLKSLPKDKGFILETAHPVKFPDAIEQALGFQPEVPKGLKGLLEREKKAELIGAEYNELREYLLS